MPSKRRLPLTGLFDLYTDADRAIHDLEAAGVAHGDISVVANNARGEHVAPAHDTSAPDANAAADDAGKGAGLGAVVGGAGGLLAGIGLLAVPGLGPVVAAGWLASTAIGVLAGGAVGAAAGGLVGALKHAGVAEEDAQAYAEGVRRGGTLVTARVKDDLAPAARAILADDQSTVDIKTRRDAYRQDGWTRFDDSAPAYTAEQVNAERARYGRV